MSSLSDGRFDAVQGTVSHCKRCASRKRSKQGKTSNPARVAVARMSCAISSWRWQSTAWGWTNGGVRCAALTPMTARKGPTATPGIADAAAEPAEQSVDTAVPQLLRRLPYRPQSCQTLAYQP